MNTYTLNGLKIKLHYAEKNRANLKHIWTIFKDNLDLANIWMIIFNKEGVIK